MNPPLLRRWWWVGAVATALAGAGWAVIGSAADLPVTPRNHSAFRSCVLTSYPKAAIVGFDTWADQSNANGKKGTGTTIQIQSANNKNNRGYVRFDLLKCVPTPDSTATVQKATLRLYLTLAPVSSRTYNLSRITGPCPESATTCWTETNLTWNNRPTAAASPTATLALTTTSPVGRYYEFDVTADVAAMVAGTASNYGWQLADAAENNATPVITTFRSKEANLAAGAPQLVVAFSP